MIRPFEGGDIDELLDVWYRASLIAHPFLSQEFLAEESSEIVDHWLPAAEVEVYETEGRVVGFLALVGNEVGAIFVHPDHQARGIGRALMDSAMSGRDFLELNVFEANDTGRRFYDAYGFRLVDRQINERAGETELRLRLERPS